MNPLLAQAADPSGRGISNLLNGFIGNALAVATSIVLLLAVISVIRAWWRAGAQISVTVIGAVILSALVLWGVVNFVSLSNLFRTEQEQLENDDNGPVLTVELPEQP